MKLHNKDGTLLDFSDGSIKLGSDGVVVDSAAAGQDASWIDVTDGTSVDGAKGEIAAVTANTPVKLYTLPGGKQFHEVSVTGMDDDANVFEFNVQVFAVNDIPTSVFDLDAWLSVGALVIPDFKCSQDQAKVAVAQSVVRTYATYLLVVINAAATAPAGDPRVRILSYNEGDVRS
jgi:hypothetical protein